MSSPSPPVPSATMEVDDSEEYEVEKIVDERVWYTNGKKEYLIKWVGYPSSENTWEFASKIAVCTVAIANWEKKKAKRESAGSPSSSRLQGRVHDMELKPKCSQEQVAASSAGEAAAIPQQKKVTLAVTSTDPIPEATSFANEFGTALDALKERAIQKDREIEEKMQRKIMEAEAPLRNEIEGLRAEIGRMQTGMMQLELFMRHRKDPLEKEKMSMEIEDLKSKQRSAEEKAAVLLETVREQETKLEETDTTLSKVANLFSSILGFTVANKAVLRVLPQVEEKIKTQTHRQKISGDSEEKLPV